MKSKKKKKPSKKGHYAKINRDGLAKAFGIARIPNSQLVDFNIICALLGLDDAV